MRRKAAITAMLLLLAAWPRPAAGQSRQITVALVPGWNNIGYVGATQAVTTALASLTGRYESVWTWDAAAQRWRGVNPLVPAAGDFAELRQNQAYWIRMIAPGALAMQAPPAQPAVLLTAGWNNFVYPGPDRPVLEALAPAADRFDSVWHWEAARQQWHAAAPAAPYASDFTVLSASRPYFLRLATGTPVVMTAPTPPPAPATPAPTGTAPAAGGGTASATPSTTAAPGTATASVTVSPTPTPRPQRCYAFQSYQPQIAEVSRAENRAGFGLLTTDPDFKLKELETQPFGSGLPVTPYIPPTLLKAIGWIESGWRQASVATPRGATGTTITSSSCAYGLMQVLSGMDIGATPSAKQGKIGTDYLSNIAAGAQILGSKWNLAPEHLPAVLPRNPRALEDWYYAVWAYHCFGEVCQALSIHNHPEDPALKWPRPMYNSPEQLASGGQFTFSDYPYQELIYGVIAHPPRINNAAAWPPLPVVLPPRGAVTFPKPTPFLEPASTLDPTTADAP